MSDTQKTEKERRQEQARETVQAALAKVKDDQAHWLSMSDVGELLGLNPYQLIRAKKEGRLSTKRLDVATPEAVRAFAEQHLVFDKNGKLRITTGKLAANAKVRK